MSRIHQKVWERSRSTLEQTVESALSALPQAFATRSKLRVVVLGGGTGLSTVLGGNPALPTWTEKPAAGLTQEFEQLHVAVCTTDDGGSTGELVRRLPMIAIGDLRKVMLAMMDRKLLANRYGPEKNAAKCIQRVMTHRFGERVMTRAQWLDPVRVLDAATRRTCPITLRAELALLTKQCPAWVEKQLRVPGHCFGNLLMTAAIFRDIHTSRTPTSAELKAGLERVAGIIGVAPEKVFPVSSVPGTLVFEYANGVVATGQARAARARRGCAVQRVHIAFSGAPEVSPQWLAHLRRADVIVYAPGSLYSSVLPVLLTPGVAETIRQNRRAIKILGANLWIQEGETDMSFREESRGFWVSELIEAYGRNVPGGHKGLFDVALATSLDQIPGSIIRNYALENKHPIHLDRARVESLGVVPIEASLFPTERWQRDSMIHHDPARFAAAIRAVVEGVQHKARKAQRNAPARRANAPAGFHQRPLACVRMEAIGAAMAQKFVATATLRRALDHFFWEKPDIPPEHLHHFDGVKIASNAHWKRSREWDNVLGYYEPTTRQIMLHEQALKRPELLAANFSVALGESLLGRYIAQKGWHAAPTENVQVYEIELLPPAARETFLTNFQLRTYLRLAQMTPRSGSALRYFRPVPKGTGFLPCGILFGLTFAWMLNAAFVPALDFEMQILQWPAARLLPYQVQTRARTQALVRFFRENIFRFEQKDST